MSTINVDFINSASQSYVTVGTVSLPNTINIPTGASDGYVLTSNSIGDAYWAASSGGTSSLSGSGTSDYLTKWTGSSILGNSIIRENGSVIAIGITPSTVFPDDPPSSFFNHPNSTYYLVIDDGRNTSFSETIRINSLGGSFSKGLRITTQNHYLSYGLLVQNKTKKSSEQAFSIGTAIYGTAGGGVNISNTLGRTYAFPASTVNSNIFNFIAPDFATGEPTGAVINILNSNAAEAPSLYGVQSGITGTVSGPSSYNFACAYEAVVSSRSGGTNYGLRSTVNGNSDYGNFGVYIETSHPSDNSKSYGIVVNSGKSVFNDGSNSYSDFQIKGDTNNNLFYADVSADNIGIGTSTPNSNSILELSSTTKGFLPPRMTETQRLAISTPPTGLIVYQTDSTEGLYIYKSTGWTFIV